MDRPVIGITTYAESASWGVWTRWAALLPATYPAAVSAAGGVPVLLPFEAAGPDAVAAIDALVLAGGADIDPARYAAPKHPMTGVSQPDRDAAELALLSAAIGAGKPVLGVCRGLQLLNVAFGGGLVQHLPDVVGHVGHQPAPRVFGTTRVRVRPGSRLAGIVGTDLTVHCYHHQAIRGLGDGLLPTAWAGDETIEAVEAPGERFLLGVQWHPEEGTDIRLFAALVAAARQPHLAAR